MLFALCGSKTKNKNKKEVKRKNMDEIKISVMGISISPSSRTGLAIGVDFLNKLKFRKAGRKKEEKPNRIKFFCCGGILGSLLIISACTSPFSIPALSYSLYTRWNVETLFFQPELGPRLTAN